MLLNLLRSVEKSTAYLTVFAFTWCFFFTVSESSTASSAPVTASSAPVTASTAPVTTNTAPVTTSTKPEKFPVVAVVLGTIGGVVFLILVLVAVYLLCHKYRKTSSGKFRLYDDVINAWSNPAAKDSPDTSGRRRQKSRRPFKSSRPKMYGFYDTEDVKPISVITRRSSNEYYRGPQYESHSTFSPAPPDPTNRSASQTVSILAVVSSVPYTPSQIL
jgi:hypothetical protein